MPEENEKIAEEPTPNPEDMEPEKSEQPPQEDKAEQAPEEEHKPLPGKTSRLHRFKHWYGSHKKWSIPLTVVVLLLVLTAIPVTRYKAAGLVMKKGVQVYVIDSKTSQPISSALVEIDTIQAETDGSGIAKLQKVPVGPHTVTISKKHYRDASSKVTIKLFTASNPPPKFTINLEATGRQVGVTVTNRITGQPLEGALIKAGEIEAKTDKKGQATLVVAANTTKLKAELSLKGYNNLSGEVEVSEQEVKDNKFALTPAGKNYFFSNRSGKIDFYSSNLDGAEQEVILKGTGAEDSDISLSISPDAKWAAFISTRDGLRDSKGQLQPALFLMNLSDKSLVKADEGATDFTIEGWSGGRVVYSIIKGDLQYDNNERYKLKSYDAANRRLYSLAVANYIEVYATAADFVVYSRSNYTENSQLYRVNVQTTNDSKITADEIKYVGSVFQSEPDLFIIQGYTNDSQVWYKYRLSSNKIEKLSGEPADKVARRMIPSPDGSKVVWVEDRDGQDTLLSADAKGENQKKVTARKSLTYPLRWINNDYIIFRVMESENADYIVALSGGEPIKIADVFRQSYSEGEYY